MALPEQLASGIERAARGLPDVLALPFRAVQSLLTVANAVQRLSLLTGAVEDLHTELTGLRSDLSSMPHDSRRLADQVEVVDHVLRGLSTDLTEVKISVAPVHDDLGRVEAGLAPLPGKLDALLPKVDELAGRLDGMREELAGQLDGLRTDLTALPFVSKS